MSITIKKSGPKRMLSVVLVGALCCSFCINAFAATSTTLVTKSWNFGSDYDGEDNGTYSPYKGRVLERMITGDGVDRATFSFDAYFTFNDNIVDRLEDHRNNGHHFTLDIANTDDYDETMDCVYIYSNLPNPKTDIEDDPFPFGNGYADEAEVVARDLVSAGKEYQMFAHFEDYRDENPETSTVEVNTAISEKSFTGEYNTVNYAPMVQFSIGSKYAGK